MVLAQEAPNDTIPLQQKALRPSDCHITTHKRERERKGWEEKERDIQKETKMKKKAVK